MAAIVIEQPKSTPLMSWDQNKDDLPLPIMYIFFYMMYNEASNRFMQWICWLCIKNVYAMNRDGSPLFQSCGIYKINFNFLVAMAAI